MFDDLIFVCKLKKKDIYTEVLGFFIPKKNFRKSKNTAENKDPKTFQNTKYPLKYPRKIFTMNYQFQTENSRACVFIDSSNPELPNQVMNHSSHPFITPPFPPHIDPKDLLIVSKDNKPSRSPNAFIIYRKVFLKTTRDQGYLLPMTIVSSMASKSWDQESDEVRNYYKKLAKDAYKYRTEKFPKKVRRRRRKEPWNANVAFQNDLHNTFYDNSNLTENLTSLEFLPTIPAKDMTKEMVNEVPSPEIVFPNYDISSRNSPNWDHQINNEFNEPPLFNENNFLYQSPNLSDNCSSIVSSPSINNEYDNSLLNSNNNSETQNAEFNLYNDLSSQDLANLLLFNPNNYSLNNVLTGYAPNAYNTKDSNVEHLTIYPTTEYLGYQDVLGINLNPICSGYENTY